MVNVLNGSIAMLYQQKGFSQSKIGGMGGGELFVENTSSVRYHCTKGISSYWRRRKGMQLLRAKCKMLLNIDCG